MRNDRWKRDKKRRKSECSLTICRLIINDRSVPLINLSVVRNQNFKIVRNTDKSRDVHEIACNISFQSNSTTRFPANFAPRRGMREGESLPSRNRLAALGTAFFTNFLRNNSTETEEGKVPRERNRLDILRTLRNSFFFLVWRIKCKV